MAYEQKDNSGALFKNDKGGNESRPDYRGTALINGAEMDISAWLKTSAKGSKYMSLSFSVKKEKTGGPGPARQPAPAMRSDEIPF